MLELEHPLELFCTIGNCNTLFFQDYIERNEAYKIRLSMAYVMEQLISYQSYQKQIKS